MARQHAALTSGFDFHYNELMTLGIEHHEVQLAFAQAEISPETAIAFGHEKVPSDGFAPGAE